MDIIERSIPAPQNHVFTSYNEAYNSLKQYSLKNSYSFQLKDSRPYSSETKTWYYYYYDRIGSYKS